MTDNSDQDKKGAGVKFPPPLILLVVILSAYAMHTAQPLNIDDASGILIAGSTIVLIALIVIIFAALSFRRAKTHLEPWQPTTVIISDGLFAVSRNPIYLAYCWICIGVGLILNSWWVLLGVVPTAALITVFVIKREEAYLEAKFGEEYLRYKSQVRRWL